MRHHRVAMSSFPIVIIGAGPCGLACARELERQGHHDWLLLERSQHPGGLAASVRDPAGFTWDLGGHVVFSHFGCFDELLEETMGDEVLWHERSSYVRFADRWVPYPFQNNLRHLPEPVLRECLDGLREAPGGDSGMDFATWMRATFGAGIARHFMEPYNLKVWATAPERMSAGWMAERVAIVDYERAAENVRAGSDDLAWGPNNRFAFPASGGTGEIYRRAAAPLAERIRYGAEVCELDVRARTLRTAGGLELRYDALVSTIALDRLVAALPGAPAEVSAAAARLRHNSVCMIGVGYRAPLRDERSWMYFPDPGVPFYRATNFAKYSPANVPGAETERFCSYMTEVAHSPEHPVRRAGLEQRVEAALRRAGVLHGAPAVASVHAEEIPYAYPVPTLDRDAALAVIQPWLMRHGILSRGRFGAWRYEIGNMDHAVKMGSDAARALLNEEPEELWAAPGDVLSRAAAPSRTGSRR
jgi:protoporphyrinogen oxidase